MTETETTPACSSKFCGAYTGPVMDGCSCVNVEAISCNGQQFLETVNRSLLAVGGKLKTKVLVLSLLSVVFCILFQ